MRALCVYRAARPDLPPLAVKELARLLHMGRARVRRLLSELGPSNLHNCKDPGHVWIRVPGPIVGAPLTPTAKLVAGFVDTRAALDKKQGFCREGTRGIAKALGISPKGAWRAWAELEQAGFGINHGTESAPLREIYERGVQEEAPQDAKGGPGGSTRGVQEEAEGGPGGSTRGVQGEAPPYQYSSEGGKKKKDLLFERTGQTTIENLTTWFLHLPSPPTQPEARSAARYCIETGISLSDLSALRADYESVAHSFAPAHLLDMARNHEHLRFEVNELRQRLHRRTRSEAQ